jgi:hypothetical protein
MPIIPVTIDGIERSMTFDSDYIEPCLVHTPSDEAMTVWHVGQAERFIHQIDVCVWCGAQFDPGGMLVNPDNRINQWLVAH